MIFAGDVAIAEGDLFKFLGFPKELFEHLWCINFEGAIASSLDIPSWGTYNAPNWTESFKAFQLAPLFAANNHIHDVHAGVIRTRIALEERGLKMLGAGADADAAAQPHSVYSGGHEYVLLGCGWPVIGCKSAGKRSPGVNRLEGRAVRNDVCRALRNAAPGARLVVVIHGNYEFERHPQPAHRKLAFQLIDSGAHAVIFHHPHVVAAVECYKGKAVAYSLGNWAFSYGKFFGGRLRFPETAFHQIALELRADSVRVHHANFSPPSTVTYRASEDVFSEYFSLRPAFEGFSHLEYISWFRKNRVKSNLLPIYKDPDSSIANWLFDRWVGVRQVMLNFAAKSRLKAIRRIS